MTRVKPTTTAMIAAAATIGLVLFSVPTITDLSFADDGSTNAAPTTTSNQKSSGSDSSSSSSDSNSKPQETPDQPKGLGPGTCEACPPDHPKVLHPWWWKPIKVIVHHDTKIIHESSGNNNNGHLTVAQQNCIAGALQLGFGSNAQNRADATYAAILGCLGSSA